MRIVLLGQSGQVGWELQRSLLTVGDVVALGRREANLEDPRQLVQTVAGLSPAIIVNAAAYTAVDKAEDEPDRADAINHVAVAELAKLAASTDALLVHYSTDYVFDGRKTAPYSEADQTSPQNVYGRSKLAGENALAASGAKHLIFRTSWVHASRGHNFVRTILRLAASRQELRIVADQTGTPTSAELIADVTARCLAAVNPGASKSGIYHLTAGDETTWHGLAVLIVAEAQRLGLPLKATPETVLPIASAEFPSRAARPANSRLDTTKLRREFGVSLPDWQTLARRTVAELVACQLDPR